MGDYTLCHLHFGLKTETPKEVSDVIIKRLQSAKLPTDPISLSEFSPCTSAYHHVDNFVKINPKYSEFYGEHESTLINTIFQVKYSRGIHEFVDYISPWIITDESNRGCIGWILSEYASSPTYLFVKPLDEDPKDKYIQDLETKCAELVEKLRNK